MEKSSVQITEFIPQRKPFVFVDALLNCTPGSAETSFAVTDTNVLVRNGVLTTSGLIEHIAQSCVAKTGFDARAENKAVSIGYIGNVKNLSVSRNPKVGETLHTTVLFSEKIGGIQLCEATVRCGDEVIAHTSIRTAQEE